MKKGSNTQSSTVPCLEQVLRKLYVARTNEYMRRHREEWACKSSSKTEVEMRCLVFWKVITDGQF